MNRPGRYIVIEGNDGTGKSTQVAMLADYFRARGQTVCVVEEPGSDDPEKSTPVANELRRIVKNGDLVRSSEINLALFSAARRELWREKIQPALQRGEIVLSARNYISTLAYQGYGDGLDAEAIMRMTKLFTDERYLQPDAMIILTLSDTQRQQRIAERGHVAHPDTFESREQSFQDRVNHAYEAIAAERNIPVLSAVGAPEEVHAWILDSIARYL